MLQPQDQRTTLTRDRSRVPGMLRGDRTAIRTGGGLESTPSGKEVLGRIVLPTPQRLTWGVISQPGSGLALCPANQAVEKLRNPENTTAVIQNGPSVGKYKGLLDTFVRRLGLPRGGFFPNRMHLTAEESFDRVADDVLLSFKAALGRQPEEEVDRLALQQFAEGAAEGARQFHLGTGAAEFTAQVMLWDCQKISYRQATSTLFMHPHSPGGAFATWTPIHCGSYLTPEFNIDRERLYRFFSSEPEGEPQKRIPFYDHLSRWRAKVQTHQPENEIAFGNSYFLRDPQQVYRPDPGTFYIGLAEDNLALHKSGELALHESYFAAGRSSLHQSPWLPPSIVPNERGELVRDYPRRLLVYYETSDVNALM